MAAYFKFTYKLLDCGYSDDDTHEIECYGANEQRARERFDYKVIESSGLESGNVEIVSIERL